jgi:penicillin-binding protein 2
MFLKDCSSSQNGCGFNDCQIMRIQVIRNIIIALFLFIAFDLFYLQVIRGGYFHRLGQNNSIRVIPFEGRRGRILDRESRILVDSEKSFHAVIIPQDLGKDRSVFYFLSTVLNEDAGAIEKRYLKGRLTPFSPVTVAAGISRQQAIKIEESTYRYPGLVVLEKYRRNYICDESCAHVLGYVGKADPFKMQRIAEYGFSAEEFVGYSGVEEAFDDTLRGAPGGRQIEVDSRGRQVRLLSMRDPSDGEDLVLTIDRSIQRASYAALAGRRGAVVVLDPDNGEVLALVSAPSFDPNAFADRDKRNLVAGYLQDRSSPLLNRAISASFPPGSVFKSSVAAGGLEERKIKPSTVFNCPGYFTVGNRVFRSPHAWGDQDLIQAMGHSANEYFFRVGLMLGPDLIARYAKGFGLGEKTGIDLPYEARGHIPQGTEFLRWFKGDTANLAIGQGSILVTPLQLARELSVIANEGRFVTPHIVKTIGGVEACTVCHASPRFISLRKDVWADLKQALYAPVQMDTGTAHILELEGMDTFGKTGTAQARAGQEDHAWFAGVTTTSKRRIAYCVLLEHGGSSANACLVIKEILLSLQEQGLL